MELDSYLERYSKFYNIIDNEHSIYTSKEIKSIPNAWRKSNFSVLFDFSEVDNYIYCIIPPELNKSFFIIKIKKEAFIKDIIENNISYLDDYINRTRQNSEYIKQYKNMY